MTRKLFAYGLTGEGDVKRMKGSPVVRMRNGDDRVIVIRRIAAKLDVEPAWLRDE